MSVTMASGYNWRDELGNAIILHVITRTYFMHFKKIAFAICAASFILAVSPMDVSAASTEAKSASKRSKTFSEEEFLTLFSHKSRKQISDALGKPVRIGQSSKPSGAEATLASAGKLMGKDKGASVEMWYYENMVRYDPKHTYKTVELSFVNDRCENITYFNTK
jgi:hypothetical protein